MNPMLTCRPAGAKGMRTPCAPRNSRARHRPATLRLPRPLLHGDC